MSTRANIVIKDADSKIILYRHSDGYPSGTMPVLNRYLDSVKSGEYRDNVMQSIGHLLDLGRAELLECFDGKIPEYQKWKHGTLEVTDSIHGDIEYLYTIDLVKKTITTKEV
jgi:hypothetical protein